MTSPFRHASLCLCLGLAAPGLVLAQDKEPAAETSVPSEADGLWRKVEIAIDAFENPTRTPQTRVEAIQQFREGVEGFDRAYEAFAAAAPGDERGWIAKLFAAKVARSRPLVGLENKHSLAELLTEIMEAKDAPAKVRSEASAALLIETANGAKDTEESRAQWKERTEAHIAAYPDEPLNVELLATEALMDPLELEFTDLSGKPFDLEKLRGKVVLLDFWATWCEPCIAELPSLRKTYATWHDKGLEIVGISLDNSVEELKEFVEEQGIPWVQYGDGEGWNGPLAIRFGITAIPSMWLINREGLVVDMHARSNLEVKVKQLLEEVE